MWATPSRVKEELWKHRAACAVVYDYYAAVGASGGAGDISFLSLNLWNQFLIDFSIINQKSKFLKQSDLDTLFITIDSMAARVQAEHIKQEEEEKQHMSLAKNRPKKAPSTKQLPMGDADKFMHKIDFYQALTPPERRKLCDAITELTFETDMKMVKEGDAASSMFILKEGSARVEKER